MEEQRWLYGEPDIIKVRKTFSTKEETQNWEAKVLRRMKVRKSPIWLNKTDRKGPSNNWSNETRQKMSIIKKEFLTNNPEYNPFFNRRCYGKDNPFFGKKHNEQTLVVIREKRKNQLLSDLQIETLQKNNIGKKFTAEHRQKMSAAQKGKPKSEEHKKALRKPKSQESKKKMSESKTGTVQCLDIQTGIKARIPSELFHSDKTRYFAHSSKTYKASWIITFGIP